MNKSCFLLIILAVILSCKQENKPINKETRLPFFNSAIFTPEWIAEGTKAYENIHTIPAFSFINQDGQKVTNKTYENKIYVADFFFVSCPSICPKLTKNMSVLQEEFKADTDILLLSHSVTPQRDSVPVLKQYAIDNAIESSKWNLVTGNKDAIYHIARQGYFADEDFVKTQDESAFIHTENFMLIDKKGRIRGVYNGTLPVDVKRLIRHIKILKKEN